MENTHVPFKNLHCTANILKQQTVQHKRIITETQKSESRGPDSLPQGERRAVGARGVGTRWWRGIGGGGPFPFKGRQIIMTLRYSLVDWRTHYPSFLQGPHDFSEAIICANVAEILHCCYGDYWQGLKLRVLHQKGWIPCWKCVVQCYKVAEHRQERGIKTYSKWFNKSDSGVCIFIPQKSLSHFKLKV